MEALDDLLLTPGSLLGGSTGRQGVECSLGDKIPGGDDDDKDFLFLPVVAGNEVGVVTLVGVETLFGVVGVVNTDDEVDIEAGMFLADTLRVAVEMALLTAGDPFGFAVLFGAVGAFLADAFRVETDPLTTGLLTAGDPFGTALFNAVGVVTVVSVVTVDIEVEVGVVTVDIEVGVSLARVETDPLTAGDGPSAVGVVRAADEVGVVTVGVFLADTLRVEADPSTAGDGPGEVGVVATDTEVGVVTVGTEVGVSLADVLRVETALLTAGGPTPVLVLADVSVRDSGETDFFLPPPPVLSVSKETDFFLTRPTSTCATAVAAAAAGAGVTTTASFPAAARLDSSCTLKSATGLAVPEADGSLFSRCATPSTCSEN